MEPLRCIRRNGRIFPWTEILAGLEGSEEIFVPREEPNLPNAGQIVLHSPKNHKPGPGWYKNNRGSWSRKRSPK